MEQIRQQLDKLLGSLLNGQPLGWNNVLDVVIVAVFIYYVLVLIRGTKAVQLLIGVLVLVLIYWIARSLQLTLTTLLLQALFAVALIALVVVFQPELRRALGQIGQLGPLNRKLTAELLASIFMTRSPLHDGAVIVRGSQILAAACLLPLEETAERSAHRYGMRHRAALSISAQTDAIVVVVSEETQAISIAAGGRIIGALDEERLRRVLSSLLPSRIQPLPLRSKAS